jgi:hypothetical protein
MTIKISEDDAVKIIDYFRLDLADKCLVNCMLNYMPEAEQKLRSVIDEVRYLKQSIRDEFEEAGVDLDRYTEFME